MPGKDVTPPDGVDGLQVEDSRQSKAKGAEQGRGTRMITLLFTHIQLHDHYRIDSWLA